MRALRCLSWGKSVFLSLSPVFYICFAFSNKLLPDSRTDTVSEDGEDENPGNFHRVEAVLGARFPGINKTLGEFNLPAITERS